MNKQSIQFITKKVIKATDPFVSITTSGSEMHKNCRFSFRNSLGQKISQTGYIVVSDVNDKSDTIYFSESSKDEGYLFKTNKTTDNGFISINSHWFAKKLEEYGWIGDYSKTYKKNGYYCIHKSDRVDLPKRKR